MTAHQLAKALLQSPDYIVKTNGWGSDAGDDIEVKSLDVNEKIKVIYLCHEKIEESLIQYHENKALDKVFDGLGIPKS